MLTNQEDDFSQDENSLFYKGFGTLDDKNKKNSKKKVASKKPTEAELEKVWGKTTNPSLDILGTKKMGKPGAVEGTSLEDQANASRKRLNLYSEEAKKNVQEYRKAISLNDEDLASVDSQMSQIMSPSMYNNYKPLAKEAQSLMKLDASLSESEAIEAAQEQKRKELYATIKKQKGKDYMNSISWFGKSDKQKNIESYLGEEKKYIDLKKQVNVGFKQIIDEDYKDKRNNYIKLNNEIGKIKQSDIKTQEDYDSYMQKYNRLKPAYDELKEAEMVVGSHEKELTFYDKRLGSSKQELDMAKRHYGVETFVPRAADTIVDAAYGVGITASVVADLAINGGKYIASKVSGEDYKGFEFNDFTKALVEGKTAAEEDNAAYYEEQTGNGVLDTVKHAGNLVISQIPNIILAAVSGGSETALVEGATIATETAIARSLSTRVAVSAAERNILKTVLSKADDVVSPIISKLSIGGELSGVERAALTDFSKSIAGKAESKALANIVKKHALQEAQLLPKAIAEASAKSAAAIALQESKTGAVADIMSWTADKVLPQSAAETVMFATSAGDKFKESFNSNNLAAGADGKTSYTPLQMIASSALWGLAETAGEKTQIKLIGGWNRTIQAAVKENPSIIRSIAEVQSKALLGKGSMIVHQQFDEHISEQFTNLSQNAIDKFILGKDVSLFDNVDETFKDTALLTGVMTTAPHIAGAIMKPFFTTEEQKQTLKIQKEIYPLALELKNPISADRKKAIEDKIKALTEEGSDLHKNAIRRIGDMSTGTWKNIIAQSTEMASIKAEAKDIYNSNSDNKNELLKGLQTKYDALKYSINGQLAETSALNNDILFKNMPTENRRSVVQTISEINRLKELSKKDNYTADLYKEKIKGLTEKYTSELAANSINSLDSFVKNMQAKYKDFGSVTSSFTETGAELKAKQLELLKTRLESDLEGKSEAAQKKIKANYDKQVDSISKEFENNDPDTVREAVVLQMPSYDNDGNARKDKYGRDIADNSVFINKEGIAESGKLAATKANHEVLHIILSKAFNINQNAFVPLANALLDHIGTKSPQLRKIIADKINSDYAKEGQGIKAEEVMTLVSELMASGYIEYDQSFGSKLKALLIDAFSKVFPGIDRFDELSGVKLNTGKDVFDFLSGYSKGFQEGSISSGVRKAMAKGVSGKLIEKAPKTRSSRNTMYSKSDSALEEKLDKLDKLYEKGELDYDDYMMRIEAAEKAYKDAQEKPEAKKEAKSEKPSINSEEEIKEVIKDSKGSIASDKVQAIYEAKGIDGAFDIIKLFRPITMKIVNKRRDAPGFEEELLRDEIETGNGGLLELIKTYKPSSGTPLAAYINKNLPLRAIAASKRVLDKEFFKDSSEEKGLMATETADQTMTEQVAERNKYADSLESEIFEPEVFKNIESKILPIVRTLKTRIDEKVSINRTVTPLISEIATEMGKQADIDIKKALGGKEGGVLRKNLLRSKRYILENMTTTWLMGKDNGTSVAGGIPQAIQKKVNGEWLSYPAWVGKKTDRESVSTDLAGRTSGAELVRRMPNVFNNVSNEAFLDQFLDPNGNPIRGRKESLSKSMAEEISFEIIKKDFANEGPLFEAFSANQERLGVELKEVLVTEFNKQSDRGNIKYSKISTRNAFFYILQNGGFEMDSDYGRKFRATLSKADKKSFDGLKKYWVGKDAERIASIYHKIWMTNKGVAFEVENYKVINEFLDKNPGFEMSLKSTVPDKYNSVEYDMVVYHDDKKKVSTVVEFKAGVDAAMGSVSNPDILNPNITATKKFKELSKFTVEMKNNPRRIAEVEWLKSLKEGVDIRITKDGGIKVSAAAWDNRPAFFTMKNPEMEIDVATIGDINIGKDLLQINGLDLVKFPGVTKPHLANIKEIDANTKARVYSRISQNSRKDGWVQIVERYFFHLDENFNQKTGYNLTNNPKAVLTEIHNAYKNSAEAGMYSKKSLSDNFNKILEETQGIGVGEQFSNITARTVGAGKGRFRFFVPPSAEDFLGLLYDFMGKGEAGEQHAKFFKDTLIHPYVKGIQRIDNIRTNIKDGYKTLKSEYPVESKKLKKKVDGKDYTYDQAVRVYLWKKNDIAVPGLSDKEVTIMSNTVKMDPELREFADKLSTASGQLNGWVDPTEYWNVESIVSDLHNATEKIGRRNILKEFIENSNEIFSPENLNKIEAAMGTDYRGALEDSLFRMKNGSNQTSTDKFSGAFVNWIANANGTIMFLNTRSAILQTISATNYLNWTDNNPVAAGAAFLNQPQYWKDFAMIFNSNKLKERRAGLKADVNEAEIANAVKGSKNKAKAALSYLLKIGYTPTQIADSFAIAAGGSTFYRNRVKTYEKQGFSTKEAEDKAFEDFDNATEESQQSSDPSKISQQQASTAGRLILAFANTPIQYNRLMKKAFRDLKNGRGDAKTHVSKILYYGAVQNIIFSALQNALFASLFDDDEEDEKKAKAKERKYANILNGMADTILRGTGIAGAIASTAKNVVSKFVEEREKGFRGDQAKTIVAALGISPPIGSKAAKLYSAINTEKIDRDIIDKRGMSVTLDGKLNLSPSYAIAGKVVASTTNFPLDRLVDKVNNVSEVLDSRNKTWQRVALALGWKSFDVGTVNEGEDLIRAEAKAERKEASKLETAKDRIIKKANKRKRIYEMSSEESQKYQDSLFEARIAKSKAKRELDEKLRPFKDSINDAMN